MLTYVKGSKLRLRAPHALELTAAATPGDGPLPPSMATPEQLSLINAMPQVLRPLAAADVYVRGCWAINDQLMHNGLRIETPGIEAIARLAPGVPLLANHDTYSGFAALPAGRLFAGSAAKRADGSTWAQLWPWMPVSELTTELVQRIDGGAIGELSVSILFDQLECSICETDLYDCAHVPLQTYDGKACEGIARGINEFLELSMVWSGMAKGTQWMLAAAREAQAFDAERLCASRPPRDPMDDYCARVFSERAQSLDGLFSK